MLAPIELLDIINLLNKEIENGIDDLSSIEKLSLETDGDITHIKFGGSLYWTEEEEEINSKDDLEEILLERLKSHKTQVDGMIGLFQKEEKKEEPSESGLNLKNF